MEDKTCFLISPLGMAGSEVRRRSDQIYEYIVKPATQRAGYSVLRANEITAPGVITSQIIDYLLKVSVVIADLSGANPNVMYELGVRHAAGKPVIPIISHDSALPFDISSIRTIVVNVNDLDSVASATETLTKILEEDDANLNLFPSPITVANDVRHFQERSKTESEAVGSSPIYSVLKDIENRLKVIEHNLNRPAKSDDGIKQFSRRVFIVHGHDGELKNELARLLERLDFEPIILHEQPDKGQTIFSKLNGEMSDVGFAFIILTPDDVGSMASDSATLKPRARQNVIFEHGLFAGYLSPQRVCALRRGEVEIPSDLHGVLYKTIPVEGSIRSIAIEIANELRAVGYILDANKLLSL